ncbi:hypothetical protein [Roseibium algae]|uniref:Uncharacterized protein n=1 Tax=Roseibium algae TaxID=3123038 RepID=A0ABU8TRB4_9HYPH
MSMINGAPNQINLEPSEAYKFLEELEEFSETLHGETELREALREFAIAASDEGEEPILVELTAPELSP